MSGPRRNAYASLITSDSFLPGLETMLFSLRQARARRRRSTDHDDADVVILVTPAVGKASRKRLRSRFGVTLREVADIPNPNADTCHVPGWINSGYTKLHIWGLVDYARVVYIDADCLVVEPVDELFAPTVATPAAAPDVFPPDKFNAGVMVIRPSLETLADMRSKLAALPSHDGGDTGFLNSYFPGWYAGPAASRLGFGYNAQRTMYWSTHTKKGYWNAVQPLKIIHYCSSPKPWEDGKKKGDLEQLWWDYFIKSKMPQGLLAGGAADGMLAGLAGLLAPKQQEEEEEEEEGEKNEGEKN